MAAVCEAAPAQKLPPSPPMTTTGRLDSMSSLASLKTEQSTATESTETVTNSSNTQVREGHHDEPEDGEGDDSIVFAIRALRLLDNPQSAAAEAIQAFDPKSSLHPELVRLLVAAAVRHPDVAQGLIELGQSQGNQLVHRTRPGALQARNGDMTAGRQSSGALHEISISSLLSSISESNNSRRSSSSTSSSSPGGDDLSRPTLKRHLSILSAKKAYDAQSAAPPPPRKDKVSVDTIKKICKANLKDAKESIEKLEQADFEDEFLSAGELKRIAEESLGHETGKFALCLALTLRDGEQRWEATTYLMTAMVDKLKLLLSTRGRFGPDGDVGLPGQDGFGVRDCWVVLSDAERERLATEDDGQWVDHLSEAAQLAPRHAAKAWEILRACEKIRGSLAPSRRSEEPEEEERDNSTVHSDDGSETATPTHSNTNTDKTVARRPAFSASTPEQITDRWCFFFDLLDEEAARRCFRELRLLRQLFNAAKMPGGGATRASNLKSRAKKAFDMGQRADEMERWQDTKWAIAAMKGFMITRAGLCDLDGGEAGVESLDRLDRLDNTFCKTFWGCLGAGDHKRLAKEDGKQWVTDLMKVFEHRRRYDAMFRLRDILHFMQSNMQ